MTVPAPLPIPRGLVVRRLPYGVPMGVLLFLGGVLWVVKLVLGSWWLTLGILPLLAVVYIFVAYHTRKDPQFLKIWTGNLLLRDYYY